MPLIKINARQDHDGQYSKDMTIFINTDEISHAQYSPHHQEQYSNYNSDGDEIMETQEIPAKLWLTMKDGVAYLAVEADADYAFGELEAIKFEADAE